MRSGQLCILLNQWGQLHLQLVLDRLCFFVATDSKLFLNFSCFAFSAVFDLLHFFFGEPAVDGGTVGKHIES